MADALYANRQTAVIPILPTIGAGGGLSIGAAGAVVAQSVAPTETGVARSLNGVVRLVGGGIGSQVAAAVLVGAGAAAALLVAAGAGLAGGALALPRRG